MYIKCWGSRGSIPVSGPGYLTYGGDTTCIEIRSDTDELVIIDAGTGIRNLGTLMAREGCRACHLLFTHVHWDHLMGLTAFAPLFNGTCHVTIPRFPDAGGDIKGALDTLFSPPRFPVPYRDIRKHITFAEFPRDSFTIGGLTFDTIPISHPNGGLGYRVRQGERSFVFLTDNELGTAHDGGASFDEYVAFARGSDLLLHDAEYTAAEYAARKGWGHSAWPDTLRLALEADVRRLGLTHHNAEHTDDAINDIVNACREEILHAGAPLDCFAVGSDTVMSV